MNRRKLIILGVIGVIGYPVLIILLVVLANTFLTKSDFTGEKPTTTVSIPSNVFCGTDGLFYIKNGNITSPVWNTNARRQYICVDTDTHIIVK